MTQLNPYLSFRDNAGEAIDFYQSVFGGNVVRSTFGEFHASDDPSEADKIMHAELTAPNGLVLMASDTPNSMEFVAPNSAITLAVSGSSEDEEELRGYWNALSEGGSIALPLEVAPWGDTFGMLTDRYGYSWMVSIGAASS
jgi:PhnB protein